MKTAEKSYRFTRLQISNEFRAVLFLSLPLARNSPRIIELGYEKKMKPSSSSSSSSSCGTSTLLTLLYRSKSKDQSCRAILRDLAAREFNAFLWISLIAVTALLLRRLVELLRLWAKAKAIPGPPCHFLYGHCKLLSRQNITEVLSDFHKEYGSVVKLWLGPTQLIVSIKDPTLTKEMLLKAADKLPLTGRTFQLAFGRSSLFASSFDTVQKRRETLFTELSGKLRERDNVIPTKAVDCVLERIHNLMGKDSVDTRVVSQHMAFTILGATLFGDSFLAWSNAAVYEELLMMIAKDACLWASYYVTPFWNHGFWKYQSLCTKLKCLTQDLVQQCRKTCKLYGSADHNLHGETANLAKEVTSGGPSCSEVVIVDDISFAELNGHINLGEEPCGNLMGIMFHGCLSTASLINNIMMNLAMHPQIQDKIYSEITMARKGSMKQDQINVDTMLLLLATIYESARLVSAGSLLQRCSLKHDFTLKSGHTIPAGAGLVVPVELVMMDDSMWGGDSCEFNPYRFLSKAGEGSDILLRKSFSGAAQELVNMRECSFTLNDLNKSTAFLPFGSGIRACIGQKFVIKAVAKLFVSLLEHHEIKLHPEAQDTPKPNNCVFQLPSGSRVLFVERNS